LENEKTRVENEIVEDFTIPSDYVGRIIGKAGENIAKLKNEFQVSIKIDEKVGD